MHIYIYMLKNFLKIFYMMGEDLAAAFRGVFMMRSVFNDMIDETIKTELS